MKNMKSVFFIVFSLLWVVSITPVSAETQLKDLNGQVVSLDDYKGKVVWLDFWASWCVPCRASFPWLNKVQKQYVEQGFEVVAINLDKDRKEVDRFLQRYPAQFQILLDPAGDSARTFKVKGMPSSYLLNREGQIVSAHLGFKKNKTSAYENEIKQLLGE